MNACKHSRDGFCEACVKLKPYLRFRYCERRCCACSDCGYFWQDGKPAVFAAAGEPETGEV